jgi:membrane protease YdiL (CAAX protease family)
VTPFRDFWFELLAWLIVAVFCTAVVIPIWIRRQPEVHGLLPSGGRYHVPWTGWEILLAFFLTHLFWPSLVGFCLDHTGFFTWVYGEQASSDPGALNQVVKERHNLWITLCIFPLNLATVLLMFRLVSGTQVYQLGMAIHSPRRDLASACVSLLIIAPIILALNFLVFLGYLALTGREPEPHPLQQLIERSPLMIDAVLTAIAALIVAPIWEELVFRGVIQAWMGQRERRAHIGMGLASFIGFCAALANFEKNDLFDLGSMIVNLSPVFFVLIILSGYFFLDRIPSSWVSDGNVSRGIYTASFLFGMVHSFAWPTPIALFFLGLALGYLAYRTQSLLAPIVFHSLFNAIACISLLLLQLAPGSKNGREVTSAGTRPAPTATSTRVPGIWQPR